jgi:hypothetical protein
LSTCVAGHVCAVLSTREIFQRIDESMTQEAIDFLASYFQQRRPALTDKQHSLLAEVCVHSSNAVMLASPSQS